jgi:hypothetical protein
MDDTHFIVYCWGIVMFKREIRNWIEDRSLPNLMEVDFHWADEVPMGGYFEHMQKVRERALQAPQDAQRQGKKYVLFTHGWSTPRRGRTTSRSQVRGLMRNKDATPYIFRKNCIQHDSVFVAAIRPLS